MPQVSRKSFVAQSKSLFVCVLCIAIANLYFQRSILDLIAGKNVDGDTLAFLLTQLVLTVFAYGTYKSYLRTKLLLTSSASKTMTVTESKSIHNASPTHTGSSDCGE